MLRTRVLGKSRPRLRVPFWPVYCAAVTCDRISRLVGFQPVLYPRRVEFFYNDRAFAIDKARNLLGYRPRVGLEEGFKRTTDWYREQGLI